MIALLCACAAEPPATKDLTTTVDSAGVRITTIAMAPGDVPRWTVDSVPALTLESPDSTGFVYISAARWLGDGRLLVADARQLGIYIYDASGNHQRTLGRKGEGPGEFRNIMTVSVVHDTIGVWDLGERRFSVFTADSGFLRLLPTPTASSAYHVAREVWLVRGDHALTYWLRAPLLDPIPQGVRIRRWQHDADLMLSDGNGAVTGQSPTFKGIYSGQGQRGDARQAFSNAPFVAAAAGRIAYGSGETFEAHLTNGSLVPERAVRWPMANEPLTEAEVTRTREALRLSMPPGAPPTRMEEALSTIVAPELLPKVRPPVSRAVFGDAGELWLGRFEPPVRGLAESYDWVVLDALGTPRGRVVLPEGTRLEAVRGNELLVSVRDSLDVQRVEVRKFVRR
ncbi:MAG: 6-bladed beta-propeller [Cytophagaceae bacterium]|nr:6-bladed beta-propeller [Gemmatimonadaceae bacterium]